MRILLLVVRNLITDLSIVNWGTLVKADALCTTRTTHPQDLSTPRVCGPHYLVARPDFDTKYPDDKNQPLKFLSGFIHNYTQFLRHHWKRRIPWCPRPTQTFASTIFFYSQLVHSLGKNSFTPAQPSYKQYPQTYPQVTVSVIPIHYPHLTSYLETHSS